MKKLTIIFALAMLLPAGFNQARADYGDMKDQVETEAEVWVGGYLNDTDSSPNLSLAEENNLAEAARRVGNRKASEWYAPNSSGSGGFLFKSTPLPSRFHLEFDYYNDNDWFGDLRYSFKDYLQVRLLPRRFYHNLENLTLFDYAPAALNSGQTDVLDHGVDDYGLRIDIDEYRVRLKTPNFPFHVYTNGEVVKQKGSRQMRFLGGDGYRNPSPPGQVRASQTKEVDQETQTVVVGANTHLGPVELDVAHKERKFDSNVSAPKYNYLAYTYTNINTSASFVSVGNRELDINVTPELKATVDTFKIHTAHTGRLFASATYSELKKTNETSKAEAETKFSYGEMSWVMTPFLSLGTKFRHQENEATAPATTRPYLTTLEKVSVPVAGPTRTYVVDPGVHSTTDTAIVSARYSLIPKSNLNLQYTLQIKDVETESAFDWSRPEKTTRNVYELGFTNWAVPKVRTSLKLAHIRIANDYGNDYTIGTTAYEPVAIDPEHTNQGTLGITMLLTHKLSLFANGFVSQQESDNNRYLGGHIDAPAEAFNQQYLLSLSYVLNEKFSISPSYTYMSWQQKRDIIWENGAGVEFVDTEYSNKQKAQNFALAINTMPIKRLSLNTAVDYTITKGHYDPTSPFDIGFALNTDDAAEFSRTSTKEWNVRLDSDLSLGRGWGLGVDFRYTEWKDDSTDNPANGDFLGGLCKITKQFISR